TTITSTATSEVSKKDVVKAVTTLITDYTVDGRIAFSPYTEYQGDDTYNIDGEGQTNTIVEIPAQGSVTYSIKIENDGNVPTPITISGSPEVAGKWTVTYYNWPAISSTAVIPYNEIISENGWLRPGNIAVGGEVSICVEIKADASVLGGAEGQYTNHLRVYSNQSVVVSDTVRSLTRIPAVYRADAGISSNAGGPFWDMAITSTEPGCAGQIISQTSATNAVVTYYIKLENDGNASDTFSITGPGSVANNWLVSYYDASLGGADITTQITGGGYLENSLLPFAGNSKIIRAEVTPITITTGAIFNLFVRTTSTNSGQIDTVRGDTTCLNYRPDIRIDLNSGGSYITGNNSYAYLSPPVANQTLYQATYNNVKVTYYVIVENDGYNDTYSLTASQNVSNWTVSYYNAVSGGTDITINMRNGVYTANFTAEQQRYYRVEVMPSGEPPLSTRETYFYAYPVNSLDRYDAVRFTTQVAGYQVDNWIKCLTDVGYTGNNIRNTTGAGQTVSNTIVNLSTVTYNIVIENEGNTAETISVSGTGSQSGWTVSYYDGGGDITVQVLEGSYTIPDLAPAATGTIRVEITAGDRLSLQGGSVITNTITSTCTSDFSIQDVVKAETSVLPDYTVDGRIALSPLYDNYQGGNSYNIDGEGQTNTIVEIP
ncbi:MAG: hypothetical protein QME51_09535, partial [Planctomycetota bacterium]|nr:hypothetical protein [Planctomycetota bacterium]